MKSLVAGCVCALTLAACGTRMAAVKLDAPLTDAELAMGWAKAENRNHDDFSEQLIIRGHLGDGATFYAKLTVTNLATADGRAEMTVSVELPDKRKLSFKTKKDRDDWTYEKDKFKAEVGDGKIEVGVGYAKIECANDQFELVAEVTSNLPPVRPIGGIVQRPAGYYVTTIPIPRGELRVKMTVHEMPDAPEPVDEPETPAEIPTEPPPDMPTEPPVDSPTEPAPDAPPAEPPATPTEPMETAAPEAASEPMPPEDEGPIELELDGVAYAEHRVTTLTPYALAHRWYGIVDLGEDRTVIVSAFEHAQTKEARAQGKPAEVQGWMFAADDDAFVVYEPALELWVKNWSTDSKTKYPLPGLVFVADPGRRTFKGVIRADSLSERRDDLASLKKLERLVVRRFMKPWTFRFDRAEFLFRKQPPGEPATQVRGAARLQVQQLNE